MPSSRITQIESSAQSAPMSTTGGIWSRHQPYLVYVHPCDTLRIRRRLRECALLRRAARPTLSDRCGSNIGQSVKAGLELVLTGSKSAPLANSFSVCPLPVTVLGELLHLRCSIWQSALGEIISYP